MEFQLIHEDYQRARKGVSTLYSDHYEVLSNAKRQLSVILAMPVLGMIGVILGFPPQLSSSSENIVSLVGYLLVVIVGVVFLIWNANRLYGSLYGRLTEVEIQASRIERDLGDPARLLTELASEGLDISSLISKPKPTVAAEGEASPIEVANWDQETNVLFEDDNSLDTYSEDNTEPSTHVEEQDIAPMQDDLTRDLNLQDLSSEITLEQPLEENAHDNLIGVDLDDLFIDEAESMGGERNE